MIIKNAPFYLIWNKLSNVDSFGLISFWSLRYQISLSKYSYNQCSLHFIYIKFVFMIFFILIPNFFMISGWFSWDGAETMLVETDNDQPYITSAGVLVVSNFYYICDMDTVNICKLSRIVPDSPTYRWRSLSM